MMTNVDGTSQDKSRFLFSRLGLEFCVPSTWVKVHFLAHSSVFFFPCD